MAGLAGTVIGLGAGLGGLVAACGEGGETTSSATGGETTSSGAGGETSTSAGAEGGREIKVGWVTPVTGAIALFGAPDQYSATRWAEAVNDGLVCGDGKNHPIKIITMDCQSDTNRAAQVAGDLIQNVKVDAIMAASTPDTCSPVADQAEALGCPCFTCDSPWQDYFYGRGATHDTPFKWTYHAFWGLEDIIGAFVDIWNQLPTNKTVGGIWPNDASGNAWASATDGFPAVLPGEGYKVVDPGRYQNFTEDFTSVITDFKNGGCEIITGVPMPGDFANMYKQCFQQGFKPKVTTVGKALLFPQAVEALGELGNLVTTEVWWSPYHPFKSSLSGETCAEFAAEFTKRTGLQWTIPLYHYNCFEVIADALKRTKDPDDKESILAALETTKMETITGPIDFTAPIQLGTKRPVKNVYKTPLVAGQWIKGTGEYMYDLQLVGNAMAPEIPVQRKVVINPWAA